MPSSILYFSYGANMSKAVLQKRRVSAESLGGAIACGHVLSFAHRGGFATLLSSKQQMETEPQWNSRLNPHGILYVSSHGPLGLPCSLTMANLSHQ